MTNYADESAARRASEGMSLRVVSSPTDPMPNARRWVRERYGDGAVEEDLRDDARVAGHARDTVRLRPERTDARGVAQVSQRDLPG